MSETILYIILAAFFLLALFRKPIVAFFRGKTGELSVNVRLQLLPSDEYKVINDLLIGNNGRTSQIDHVVVSEYGIFVIETKNYMGWIYGGNYSENWTQNIYGNKREFRNPILQNQGHVRALKHLLPDCPYDVFIPIVTFSGRATLKVSTNEPVVYWSRLQRTILSYTTKQMTPEKVQQIYQVLLSANLDSNKDRKQHVKYVKSTVMRNEQAVSSYRCPQCGGKLVLRNGKYGQFYGCQNYPDCRYTHPV